MATVDIPFDAGLTPITTRAYERNILDHGSAMLYKRLGMATRGVRIGTFLREYGASLPSPAIKSLRVYVRHGEHALMFDDVRSDDPQWCDRLKEKIGTAVGATGTVTLKVPGAARRGAAATLDNSADSFRMLARATNNRVVVHVDKSATKARAQLDAPPKRVGIMRSMDAIEQLDKGAGGEQQRRLVTAFDDLRKGLRQDTTDSVCRAAAAGGEDCDEAAMDGMLTSLNNRRAQSRLLASMLGATDLGALETSLCSSITASIAAEKIGTAVAKYSSSDERARAAHLMVHRAFKNATALRQLRDHVRTDGAAAVATQVAAGKQIGGWFSNVFTGFRCYQTSARCAVPKRRVTPVHVLKVEAVKAASPPPHASAVVVQRHAASQHPYIAIGPGGCYGPAIPQVPRVVYDRTHRHRHHGHHSDSESDSDSGSDSDCSPYHSPRGTTVQNTFVFTDKSVHYSSSDSDTRTRHYGIGAVTQQPKTDAGPSNDTNAGGDVQVVTPGTLAATAAPAAERMLDAAMVATMAALANANGGNGSDAEDSDAEEAPSRTAPVQVVTPNTLAASARPVQVVTPNTLAASARPVQVVTPSTLATSARPVQEVTQNGTVMTVEDLLRSFSSPIQTSAASIGCEHCDWRSIGCNVCGGKKKNAAAAAAAPVYDDDDDDDYDDDDYSDDEDDKAAGAQVTFSDAPVMTSMPAPVTQPLERTVMVRVQQKRGQAVANVFLTDASGVRTPLKLSGAAYETVRTAATHMVVGNAKAALPAKATHVTVTANGHVINTSAPQTPMPTREMEANRARLVLVNPSSLSNEVRLTGVENAHDQTVHMAPNSTQTLCMAPGEYHFTPDLGTEHVDVLHVGNSYTGVLPTSDNETFELMLENRHADQKAAAVSDFMARPEVRRFVAAEQRSGVLFAPINEHNAKLGTAVDMASHFCVTDAKQNLEVPASSDRRFYMSSDDGTHLYTVATDKTAVHTDTGSFALRGMWVHPSNAKIAVAAFDGTPEDVAVGELVF